MEGIECSTNESLPFINVVDNKNLNHRIDFSTKRRRGGGVQVNLLQETYRQSKTVRSKLKICNNSFQLERVLISTNASPTSLA